jgi:hypothetical protein
VDGIFVFFATFTRQLSVGELERRLAYNYRKVTAASFGAFTTAATFFANHP